MKIIAYQFEANQHCIGCTMERFAFTNRQLLDFPMTKVDENGISPRQRDSESNLITPIFSTDENQPTHCGTCRQPI